MFFYIAKIYELAVDETISSTRNLVVDTQLIIRLQNAMEILDL